MKKRRDHRERERRQASERIGRRTDEGEGRKGVVLDIVDVDDFSVEFNLLFDRLFSDRFDFHLDTRAGRVREIDL